ncbi:uncharacterized protein N7498_002934 [Penicillium cinerascens]|uniref:Uncharacterized protein n=1 Tax=Penicillium cinerascens TaxID=70096 RepID=A0A9W9TBD4_9EURO|nr:uncharacterized protein N7498_002934 [Penicillium cinerascens]KAJ5216527.1 hypothetical protein N7498_002934 [Penicillium cinerascens]
MKSLLIASFFISAAFAGPVELPPQVTPPPSLVEKRGVGQVDAIVPTTSGQIGINPVLVTPVDTTAPYNTFFSDYIDAKGSWTAKDTEYITQVQVTTKDNKPTTATVTAPVAVMTGPKGDLDVLMSPKLEQQLSDMMGKVPACSKKREALCGITQFLEDFKADNSELIKALNEAVKDIQFLSEEVLKALGTSATAQEAQMVATGIGGISLVWMAFQVYAKNHLPLAFGIRDPPNNNIPTVVTPPPKKPEKCPADAPKGKDAPLCPDCKGKDDICQDGKYKYCKCLDVIEPTFFPFDQDWLNTQADVLKYALVHMDDAPKVTCSDTTYSKAVAVDVAFVNSLSDKFCKGDAKKARNMTLSGDDISSQAYKKYTFDFSYTPPKDVNEQCDTDCAGAIKAMTAGCEGLNSHSVQKGGKVTLPCGAEYSYNINMPDRPDQADITCANGGAYSGAIDVDISFFQRMSENFCGRDLSKTPKVDLTSADIKSSAYQGYKFHFETDPRTDCVPDCKATFEKMIIPKCEGINSHAIQPSGEATFACGASFSYKIEKPAQSSPPPTGTTPGDKLGSLQCHGANDFGKHKDISPGFQNQYTGWACAGTALSSSIMDEKSDPIVWQTMTNGAPYYYSISWVKGCRGAKQSPWTPLGDQKYPNSKDQITCTNLLRKDYTDCNNGGVGGIRDAGCLRYEFKAQYTK